MHCFQYHDGQLCCEDLQVAALARKYGTPLYVYSEQTLTEHFLRLDAALGSLDRLICFAVKANSNLAILRALANLGSGFDIVSGGELQRVMAAGATRENACSLELAKRRRRFFSRCARVFIHSMWKASRNWPDQRLGCPA